MFKLTVVAIGREKDNNFQALGKEYAKRSGPYAKIRVVELPEEPFGKNYDAVKVKKVEGGRILDYLTNNARGAFVVALERTGQEISSEKLAELTGDWGRSGREIVFVIGGALGLSPEVLVAADSQLSLSKMTFTHFMARVFLLEQIYRALTILQGKKYHY